MPIVAITSETEIMRPLNHVRDIDVNTFVIEKSCQITNVMTIADRLREARIKAGLTQSALAKRAGVSQGTIANIENGTRSAPRNLLELAKALNLNPEWLKTGGKNNQYIDFEKKSTAESPWPFRAIKPDEWSILTQDQINMIESYAQAFIDLQISKTKKNA